MESRESPAQSVLLEPVPFVPLCACATLGLARSLNFPWPLDFWSLCSLPLSLPWGPLFLDCTKLRIWTSEAARSIVCQTTDKMASDLEQLCFHVNEKISNIKRTLSLRHLGQEPASNTLLNKIGDEIVVVNELLNKFELEIQYLEQTNASLKELCDSLEEDYKDVEHLKENIPAHLPQVKVTQSLASKSNLNSEEPVKADEPAPAKKPPKEQKNIKEMLFITTDEFNGVPAYMKSRLTYCQINDVIKEINKAVVSKYKIVHQPKASLNSVNRNLYHRFISEETKDTKGHYFIVEEDIKEFTTLKADKRFYMILNILRHCRRLSEVRGGGLTRYVIA